jgi:hypothetical protein
MVTYNERNLGDYIIKLNLFFNCVRYSDNCEKPSLEQQFHTALVMIANALSASLPVFLLMYVVDCEKLKKYVTGKKDVKSEQNIKSQRTISKHSRVDHKYPVCFTL